ncbi:hypothetical protein C1645_833202 [Glomus cerebriforme]|uniref:Uncharacterized protein n=1 Tax=Glomus cerebriforme TaxID=658196 RepID=A0A397SMJ6_9GLOM|nr:hypothetical protein C1645_833202 [Glomus cerebriforme]
MERIYVTYNSTLNLNPNKINNIIALAQNDSAKSGILRTKRWQNRKRLEVLERHQDAPNKFLIIVSLPNISVTNITSENPAKCGGYTFALLGSKICLVQFLAMYHKLSNYHPYIDSNCENFTENMGYLIVKKKEMAIYNFFKSIINKLQLIIATKLTNGNAE